MITLQNLIPDFSKKLHLKAAAAASLLFLSVTRSAIPSFAASSYDNLAVANVTSEPLNMRTKPSTDGEIVGKCYRGAGGTVLEKKDGWTKVRSGKIEGWMSDKYLLFGTDIEPLAKELGLLSAKITATTLNVRETPSTDSAILKQAAEGDSFPVLSESDGWTKVQLSADTNGYISSQYASIGPVPAAAVDAKEESAALSASGNETSAAPSYVISATEDEIYLMAATAIATLIMVIVEFKRNGIKFAFSAPVDNTKPTKQLTGVRGGLAMITPLIPIVLVAFLKVPVTPAFTVGIIWCLLFTSQSFSKAMNQMTKTCYDGITDAGPAVILMVGIGILFLAVTNASVKEVLNPLLLAIVPTSRVPYIIFFAILAPLALYRGPMNMFGLGSGIAALIIGLGTLNPLAVMAAFLAAERIQCGGDPTNTQNVWTANFCEVDVNTCTKKMLPYLWAVSIVGVILGAMLYF